MRRDGEIGVLQLLRHVVDRRLLHAVEETVDHASALERRRREHELAHDFRMPDRDMHRDRAAVAEAEEIGLCDVQVVEQRGSVVRRLFERERAIGTIGGVAVALLLERDDLPMLRQLRQDLRE